MPYRRLHNTDNARIRALRAAVDSEYSLFGQGAVSFDVRAIKNLLRNFESMQLGYKESLATQSDANRKLQRLAKNARLYISHFIQVLNFSVIRNEIKRELKTLYELAPEGNSVPDLTTSELLLHWGEKIINGEQARLGQGGTPIFNPTIARVNVAYSLFKESHFTQKTHQNTTNRYLIQLQAQRAEVDRILCTLWNQIETAFATLPARERLERCKSFGIVYYLRKEERISENN